MSIIYKIGIVKNSNQKIKEVQEAELISGKGIVGDRHFYDYNDPKNQISLIESENIDYYNQKFKVNISYLNFRRNVVTKGIKLNQLIGKKIQIGDSLIEVNDLCRPCKHLQDLLCREDIIKEFLLKGGLRCEILTSGFIYKDDTLKIL